MPTSSISLIVLRAANLDRTLEFYKILGLEFVQEQHGKGPTHFSCELGGIVVEIYPGKPGSAPDRKAAGATMLGFRVTNIDQLVDVLQNIGEIVLSSPQDSDWGQRAVVQDPDGRAIELTTSE